MKKLIWCFAAALVLGAAFLYPTVRAHDQLQQEYTDEDIALLARLISAEARGEEYTGQLAVGNVVVNRLHDGTWGDTLREVIFAEGQFAAPMKTYTESCLEAAREALTGDERAVPEFVLYFQREKTDHFYAPWYATIGAHNFYGAPNL